MKSGRKYCPLTKGCRCVECAILSVSLWLLPFPRPAHSQTGRGQVFVGSSLTKCTLLHNRTTSGHSPLSDTPMWSRAGDTSVDSVTRVVRRVLMRRTSAQRTVIVGHQARGRTSVSLVITNGWRTPNPIQPNICVPRKGRHTGSQRTSPHSPQNNISETLFLVYSD